MANKTFPQRKSPRLQSYDYSQNGAYFVTICTYKRELLFGDVKEGGMVLTLAGTIADEALQRMTDYWSSMVELDAFVVMPNHIHSIILLMTDAQKRVPTLGRVVNSYKGGVTRSVRQVLNQPYLKVWQSRYHDHIIRDEAALNKIREYILANPMRWRDDSLHMNSE